LIRDIIKLENDSEISGKSKIFDIHIGIGTFDSISICNSNSNLAFSHHGIGVDDTKNNFLTVSFIFEIVNS